MNGRIEAKKSLTSSFTKVDITNNFWFFVGCSNVSGALIFFKGNIWELKIDTNISNWSYYDIFVNWQTCRITTWWDTYEPTNACREVCTSNGLVDGTCGTLAAFDAAFTFSVAGSHISGSYTIYAGYNSSDETSKSYEPSIVTNEGYLFAADTELLNFTGDDYYKFADTHSVEIWLKPDWTDAVTRPIFQKVSKDYKNTYIKLEASESTYTYSIKNSIAGNVDTSVSGQRVATTNWQHVVVTFNIATEITIWADGLRVGINSFGSAFTSPADSLVANYYFFIGHNLNENPDSEISFRGHIWMINFYESAKTND